MKNFLAPVMKNHVVNTVVSHVSKFYVSHESAILTGGTIGFSIATTAVTYKNSEKIHDVIRCAKRNLAIAETKEEKNDIYAQTLKALAPLVAPIILFQTMTIATSLFSKKQSDKKLAAAAGALSIAEQAIAQYQQFQKDAEQALGEKKYEKLQNDIYKDKVITAPPISDCPEHGAPGEELFIDKYSGQAFWAIREVLENDAHEMSRMLSRDGGYDQICLNDWYDIINKPGLHNIELAQDKGYFAEYAADIDAKFAPTSYAFPSGRIVAAWELYLFPEPEWLGNN